jgi:MOSC domain-containing protein YiiM
MSGVTGTAVVIERIFTSPARGAPQVECERLTVRAGMGPVGDRNFGVGAHAGQNLTLVEAEEVELFCVRHGRATDLSITRRNLVTRGVRLNALLNAEFSIGTVRLRGVELCEPCAILGKNLCSKSLAPASVIRHWVGRGGLRVDVLTDGEIVRGARIQADA